MKKIIITFGLIICVFPATAVLQSKPDGKSPCRSVNGTQAESNACARLKYRQADGEMKEVYRRLISELSKYSNDGKLRRKLEQAQWLWLLYRDANCGSEALIYHGGSIRPAVYNSCLSSITEGRTKRIKIFFETITKQQFLAA